MRRLASTTIILMALLLATLAAAPGVSAQAADEHPVIGAWIGNSTPEDTTDPLELLTFAPGGIVVSITPGSESGYGSWVATGERSVDATILIPLIDPTAGFVGYLTARTSIDVAEDGQSIAGTYTIELPAGIAEAMGGPVGQLGPGALTGQRIAVEPMGEPVGPLPAEGGPEPVASPPTPEASPAA